MTQTYSAASIQILDGLTAVRTRPGMYIGSSDSNGLHHLVYEILDNAIDEAINGYGHKISLTIEKDNTIQVVDEGRGVPVDRHASGKSALEVIFTVLHAGGKFSSQAGYKTSGGLHGVGASVVNALSSFMEVTSYRDGHEYRMTFKNGASQISKLEDLGPSRLKGTKVRFLADASIFKTLNYSYTTLAQRMRDTAFLLSGLTMVIKDERSGKEDSFHYDHGLKSFIEFLTQDHTRLGEPMIFSKEVGDIKVEAALQYTDDYLEDMHSYVNLVRTKEGGSHEIGLRTALTKCFNDFARKHGLLKEKDKNFEGNDVREGLTMLLSLSIPENILEFEGQTKSKLGTPQAKSAVESVVIDHLSFYLEENREFATGIIKKIQKAKLAREAARKAREAARQGKKGRKSEAELSGKLANAQSKNPKKNELFIVEGDSAGGSAKQGRDSSFQAVLPLRGKVLNVEKAKLEAIVKNVELNTLIHCIGAGVGSDFDVEDSNYDKVVIMTDADTDGAHIQVLLLTFFYRFMRPLVQAGKVYLAQPPLYRIYNQKESHYCYDEESLDDYRKTMKNYHITRFKGLGEMNASQLWETTMNPTSRVLRQVAVDDSYAISEVVKTLMGDDADARKEWINQNIDFDGSDA